MRRSLSLLLLSMLTLPIGAFAADCLKAPVRAASTSLVTHEGAQTVDDVAVAAGDSVLDPHGIWTVRAGPWSRRSDSGSADAFPPCTSVLVLEGTTWAGKYLRPTNAAPFTLGSTRISWADIATVAATTVPFSSVTAGTNATALVIGTGGSLSKSGTGTITASAAPFSGVTAGTNAAALVVGTGGSLAASGSGTITATAMPFSGLTAGTSTIAMLVGDAGSIGVTGTGTVDATTLLGNTWAAPEPIGTGTPAAATFTDATLAAAGILGYTGRALLTSPADGVLYLTKNDGTSSSVGIGFGDDAADARLIQNGGASLSLQRNDAGGFASLYLGELRASGGLYTTAGGSYFGDVNRAMFAAASDGDLALYNSGGSVHAKLRTAELFALVPVSAKTAAYPVVVADKGTTFTDEGAGAPFAFTLHAAAAGYEYTFIRTTANQITITAEASDTIQVGTTTTAAGGSITLDTDGASVRLVAINAVEWIATSTTGTVTP